MPAPTHIFIARHGSRLDAAHPLWTTTSPTPYDTPLTYHGFLSSRTIGTRITSFLPSPPPRIIIHTSPFLRCIQTAISISTSLPRKPLLRIDETWAEWMTPDYYTDITPPPPAGRMAADAKAELLRPGRRVGGEEAYTPLVPNHAVKPDDPIPEGYVAHAQGRVDIDYRWDSGRLGSGGEEAEEWMSMHRRFREGFRRMMRFYEEEGGEETVVVVVTHGAGCNALLGVLTFCH